MKQIITCKKKKKLTSTSNDNPKRLTCYKTNQITNNFDGHCGNNILAICTVVKSCFRCVSIVVGNSYY